MMSKEWINVVGVSNLDEANDSIYARFNGEEIEMGYMAFCGMKIVCISGLDEVVTNANEVIDYASVQNELGDDWEVAFLAVCNGEKVLVAIDANSEVVIIDGDADVCITQADEFDGTELDEVDSVLLTMFGL